jgi:hypothetical protein
MKKTSTYDVVNSEFVQVNFKLKNGLIERYKEKDGSVLITLIRSVIYKLKSMFYTGYAIMKDKSKIPNTFIHCKYNL